MTMERLAPRVPFHLLASERDTQIPVLKATTDQIPRSNESKDSSTPERVQPSFKVTRNPFITVDKDVAAYKIVIWQESNE
jgi:hypothetical protein